MSRLEYLSRPLVAFDAHNKDHRRYYAEFVQYNGWGKCPVRFVCTEEHGQDLVAMIKNSLVQYYVDREFGGSKLTEERAHAMAANADVMYKKAEALRKEATAMAKPRRA